MILPMELMFYLYGFVEDIDARVALRLIFKHQRYNYNPQCRHLLPPFPDFNDVTSPWIDEGGHAAGMGWTKSVTMPGGRIKCVAYTYIRFLPPKFEYHENVSYYPGHGSWENIIWERK